MTKWSFATFRSGLILLLTKESGSLKVRSNSWIQDQFPEDDDSGEIIDALPPLAEFEKETGLRKRGSLNNIPKESADPDFNILLSIYSQRKTQAQAAFWVAIPMGIAGVFLICASAFLDSVKAGVGGGIIEALTFFMIRFNREVNRGLDAAVRQLNFNRRIEQLFVKAEQISDPKARDKAISGLIENLSKPLSSTSGSEQ